MKKIISLATGIVAVCTFAMCAHSCINNTASNNKNVVTKLDGSDYEVEVIVVDSCEYLRDYHRLTHKGNCKFCTERRKKELEDLVAKLKENYYDTSR